MLVEGDGQGEGGDHSPAATGGRRCPLAARPARGRRGTAGRSRPRRRPQGARRLVLCFTGPGRSRAGLPLGLGERPPAGDAPVRSSSFTMAALTVVTDHALPALPLCAICGARETSMVLESPLAHAQLVLHDVQVAALISALASPLTAQELATAGVAFRPRQFRYCWSAGRGGMVDDADSAGWKRRRSAFARAMPGSFTICSSTPAAARAAAMRRPAPRTGWPVRWHCRRPPSRRRTESFTVYFGPSSRGSSAKTRRFPSVMEHDAPSENTVRRPLSARQLGEFFYRVARSRARARHRDPDSAWTDADVNAPAPYPSGGALYELEFYAAIACCDGLDRGLYYYEPRGHGLIRTDRTSAELDRPVPRRRGLRRDQCQTRSRCS